MRKYFMTICGWVLAMTLTAQERAVHDLPLPTLQTSQTPQAAKRYAHIASVEVLSNLADSSFIGVEPSASPNLRTDIVISGGAQTWLQAYADAQLGPTYDPSGKKLIWVINTLRAGTDSTRTGIVSFVRLAADIYVEAADTNYRLLSSFDTVIVSSKGRLDHGITLAAALRSLCDRSAALAAAKQTRDALDKPGDRSSTKEEILAAIDPVHHYQILSAPAYNRGAYLSFGEFLDNAPSITNFYAEVDASARSIRFFNRMPDSSLQALPSVWGICIRNELYRYQDGQLYPIERNGKGFMLSKYIDYRKRKNQAMYWRYYIGEQQGDNNPYNDAHVYRAAVGRQSTVRAEATQLNMLTGNID